MQVKPDKTIEITLVLSEAEARWLKGFIQNCPYPEPPHDSAHRGALFNGLVTALDGPIRVKPPAGVPVHVEPPFNPDDDDIPF